MTTAVVVSPQVTGNIGSCRSEKITVETGNKFFYTEEKTIVTNSCSGEVTAYGSWSLGGSFLAAGFLVILAGLFVGIYRSI